MSKDRQIVLMLIRREREAISLFEKHVEGTASEKKWGLAISREINALESARKEAQRILRGE